MSGGAARGHVVVVGAGIAGLVTGRVLAEHFDHVTIVDRDELPEGVADRRGAIQGRHAHALLARGQQILEALFPGLTDQLQDAGARIGDVLGASRLYFSGHRLQSAPSGLITVGSSRALLENRIRARVGEIGNVIIRDRCRVSGLLVDSTGSTVTGLRLEGQSDGEEIGVDADLVVDASGRNSAAPTWLSALGFPSPPVQQVHVDVAYATRRFRMSGDALSGDITVINAPTPSAPRAGALALLEDGVGMVTLAGICGDRPPLDPRGFAAFARSLAFPDIGEAIADADPIDDPVPHRFASSTWRRFDRLERLPDGFAVLGDGVCSFNPIYGQGMTLATLEALLLAEHLTAHGRLRPRRFHRQLAGTVRPAWEMAAGADLQFPDVRGPRRRRHRHISSYIARLHAAGARDAELSTAFVRVVGMVDPPTALLRPQILSRVVRARPNAAEKTARSARP